MGFEHAKQLASIHQVNYISGYSFSLPIIRSTSGPLVSRLPGDGVHLRADERCPRAHYSACVQRGQHLHVHVRTSHAPAHGGRPRLGVGWLQRQRRLRAPVLAQLHRHCREGTRLALHDEPSQQRGRETGESPGNHFTCLRVFILGQLSGKSLSKSLGFHCVSRHC